MKIGRIETFILGTGSSKDLLFCRSDGNRHEPACVVQGGRYMASRKAGYSQAAAAAS
jgi:hypothetical protein